MHKFIAISFAIILMAIPVVGCTTKPDLQEIKEIPNRAEEILSLDLSSESGTFSKGDIQVSSNGYLIFDTRNTTGTLKAIEIKDALTSDTIYTISKPAKALYDSSYYDYNIDREYNINFKDAKNITGTIVIYFVKDDLSWIISSLNLLKEDPIH